MQHHLNEISSFTDKQLFEAVCEGNERAFQHIFTRFYPRMISFAGMMVKSRDAAEEIVQEVFIRLWEQRELLSEVKSPENYLFIVIRNQALNHLRAAAKEQNRREQLWEALQQRVADDSTTLEMLEADQFFEQIVARLTPQQQLVFRMSRTEGYSHQQIADQLHLSKETVKKHIANSLTQLRSYLKHFRQVMLF